MDKKYLILGLVALAGGYYWYTTRKSTKNKADEMPTGGERPPSGGAALPVEPDVLPASPSVSEYEGKNLFFGNPEDGSYIDGAVYKISGGEKTPYTSPEWNDAVANGAVGQAVSMEVLNSIPDFVQTASFANASGDFFSVQSSKW